MGVVGFWLSPLREIVMHWIWKESACVTIISTDSKIDLGNEFEVYAQINPDSRIAVSEGVMHFSFDSESLILRDGTPSFRTPEVRAPALFPEKKRLVFQAVKNGQFEIAAILQTKYGEYKAATNVDVNYNHSRPTKNNFSGKWGIKKGFVLGEMELIQRGSDVSGFYRFDSEDEEKGTITGLNDGTVLMVQFVSGGEERAKWDVQAMHVRGEDYLELKGSMTQLILKNNNWIQVGEEKEFYGTTILR